MLLAETGPELCHCHNHNKPSTPNKKVRIWHRLACQKRTYDNSQKPELSYATKTTHNKPTQKAGSLSKTSGFFHAKKQKENQKCQKS